MPRARHALSPGVSAGTEALFADMGHFSRQAIQLSTLSLVYPALIITYLGQVHGVRLVLHAGCLKSTQE